MLALYHWEPTGNSAEPIIALKEKGLDFESRYVDLLKFEQHQPDFLEINAEGQVPVLVHDGHVVTETTLMLMYVEAAFPEMPLLPESAQERYQVHVWSKYADEYFAPTIAMLGWHQVMYPRLKGKLEAARAGLSRLPPERQAVWQLALDDTYTEEDLESARSRLAVRIKLLEEALSQSAYLAGPRYSLADIMMFPLVRSLPTVVAELVNEKATPRTLAWLEAVAERPAVRATLAMAKSAKPEAMFAPGPEMPRWG
jgi:GST-like protein